MCVGCLGGEEGKTKSLKMGWSVSVILMCWNKSDIEDSHQSQEPKEFFLRENVLWNMNSMAVGYYYIPSESKIMCMMLKLKSVSRFSWYLIPFNQLWLCMFATWKIHTKTKKWWVSTSMSYFKGFGSKAIGKVHWFDSKGFTVDVAMSLSQLSVHIQSA